MEPSPRKSESNPSSLLWAHEIRRENIHLAEEIHIAKASLTSTVDTINDLNQTVNELTRQVKQVEANTIEHLECLDIRITNGSDNLLRRVEALEIENGRLKEELVNVGKACDMRSKVLSLVLESINTEIMNEVRTILAQERGALRVNELLRESHGDGDAIASTQERGNSLQALSETTWGPSRSSSIEGRRSTQLGLPDGMVMQSQENLRRLFKQNARPLGTYWSYATATRIQLPLWIKSSEIAKAFVHGLEDTATRDMMERKLCVAGWSWDVLAGIMHNKLNETKFQTARLPVRLKAGSGKPGEASKPNTPIKHKKKKRRVIPIIPPDEDDLENGFMSQTSRITYPDVRKVTQ